jgi:hypothetical protein
MISEIIRKGILIMAIKSCLLSAEEWNVDARGTHSLPANLTIMTLVYIKLQDSIFNRNSRTYYSECAPKYISECEL